jgi:dipeptidyl aminopeptidase/acylaminoacyl peptidase
VKQTRPYGTWPAAISAAVVAAQGVRLGAVAVDGDAVYWLEGRPQEGGRYALVRRTRDGSTADVVPTAFNVRSRVHEYGGGAYTVSRGNVYFSNFLDQRIYRTVAGSGKPPVAVTPEGRWFFADLVVDPFRNRIVCVREDHSGPGEAVNTLVSIPLAGEPSAGLVIATSYDFYSTPRLSPDGSQLSWLSWRHPNMPWDGTELWIADVADSGELANPTRIAGGDDESIYQPGWGPDGTLYFVSDRDNWWRLYRSSRSNRSEFEAVLKNPPPDAEFGRPQWIFGTATWAFIGPSRILAAYTHGGRWHLADIDAESGEWRRVEMDLEPHDWIAADADVSPPRPVFVAASTTRPDAVVCLDPDSGDTDILRAASSVDVNAEDIALPHAIEFPTAQGEMAYANYYAPTSRSCQGPADERPPLIAISHGGPTAAANSTFDLKVQFWTNRGFAVVDVNYRGSSGFGRAYRNLLRRNWGIADVDDMVHAARHMALTGRADGARLIVRGGSAGGYTTLAALVFRPGEFKAGASYYGVSDIEVLARDTHKFESRYDQSLIGPYPEARAEYRARSPIHFVDRLACPIILFQGLEDKVVPPNQSEMMADAARANGLPVAYLAFAGEQHGFRKAETIVACLEAELYFYGAVFDFTPADELAPIQIDNSGHRGDQ